MQPFAETLKHSHGFFLLTFTTVEIDAAMRIYLGGASENGAIQIGLKDERLAEKYANDYIALKTTLDLILDAATDWAENKSANDQDSIYSWLAEEMPSLSEITRKKIAAHVIYYIEH